MRARDVHRLTREILRDELHARQVLSLSNGATGVIHAAALGVHAIGRGLAVARGVDAKHAIKQVDRLLSNQKLELTKLFKAWVAHVLSGRPEAVIALDWTEFAKDGQSTIAAYLTTTHGRATPLVWRTFPVAELSDGGRTDAEDLLLLQLRACLPPGVSVTLLADRGFADQALYELLQSWGWDFVIRMRRTIQVTDAQGQTRAAGDWVTPSGPHDPAHLAACADRGGVIGSRPAEHAEVASARGGDGVRADGGKGRESGDSRVS